MSKHRKKRSTAGLILDSDHLYRRSLVNMDTDKVS